MTPAPERCGYRSDDRLCIDGYLWELTYSDSAPPGQRQNTGIKCPKCGEYQPAEGDK